MAPINVVQIENKYPMMLAERDLLRKVWKKAAMPICAKDHPKETRKSNIFEVLMKKAVSNTRVPTKKKTKLVITQSIKLKTKKVNQ